MPYSRDAIVIEAIFLFVIIGSLTITNALYLYRYDIERAVCAVSSSSVSAFNEVRWRILELINEVKDGVSRIRGLKFDKEIDIMLINTSWAMKAWAPKEREEVPEEMKYKEMVYKATLLVPLNFSVVEGQRGWVAMFLAATVGTTLYINTDYFNPDDRGARNVLAHELTHILQSLHLRIEGGGSSTDSMLASLALIEGDAGWTQHLYCIETGLCEPSPTLRIDTGNLYISLQLFPYIYGENFIRVLYTYGGWNLVNKAYRNPPISTSMVMKPERYIAYVENGSYTPENIVISNSYRPYRDPLYSDTLGEYYLLLILAKRIGLENASRAADGWNGDKIELYLDRGPTGYVKWAVYWNISWASEEEAREFYQTLMEALKRETDSISIYNNVVHATIYGEGLERGWEPGTEIIPSAISIRIELNNRFTFIVSEVTELAYICKACG